MSEVQVPKLVHYVATGSQSDEATASKLVIYVLLRPGEGDDASRQGHVYSQIIQRD